MNKNSNNTNDFTKKILIRVCGVTLLLLIAILIKLGCFDRPEIEPITEPTVEVDTTVIDYCTANRISKN